jgi:hypothetical protein
MVSVVVQPNIQSSGSHLKPPKPIFVESSIKTLQNLVKDGNIGFKEVPLLKAINKNLHTKILCSSMEDKAKTIEKLRSQQFQYFTYAEKSAKPLNFVLFGYLYKDCKEVLQDLKDNGYNAISVSSRSKNEASPVYCVSFSSDSNTSLRSLRLQKVVDQIVVSWDLPRRDPFRPTQCHRCQRFGHTKKYCDMKPRCVKCDQLHLSSDCPRKDRTVGAPICANCAGEHPANSPTCPHFVSFSNVLRQRKANSQHLRQQVNASVNQRLNTAGRANPRRAAPPVNNYSFPPLPNQRGNNVSVAHNDNRSGQSPPSVGFHELSNLSTRFNAIPDIALVMRDFEDLIVKLEQAPNRQSKLLILAQSCLSNNGN